MVGHAIYLDGRRVPFTDRIFLNDLPMDIVKLAEEETIIQKEDAQMRDVEDGNH